MKPLCPCRLVSLHACVHAPGAPYKTQIPFDFDASHHQSVTAARKARVVNPLSQTVNERDLEREREREREREHGKNGQHVKGWGVG